MNSIDVVLFQYLNSWVGVSPILDHAIVFFATYFWFALLVCALGAPLFLHIGRNKEVARKGIMFSLFAGVSALIARLGVTELIRFLYYRPRPFASTNGAWDLIEYANLIAEKNTPSFPSGHASVVFALAAAVSLYYPKWGIWFFIGAILVGAARVAIGVHWPSDIAGGAIVGIASVFLVRFVVGKYTRMSRGIQ